MTGISSLLTIYLTSICSLLGFAQDSSFVTIHYPKGLPAKRIFVDYFDGKTFFRKAFDTSPEIIFSKRRYWRYADVVIYYPDTVNRNSYILNTFWVGDRPADIFILPDS